MLQTIRVISLLSLISFSNAAFAQSTAELDLVKKLLFKLQGPSFAENIEYCGFIGFDRAGKLIASPASRGDAASCRSSTPKHIKVIIASYHTHAGYSNRHVGELPSDIDVEGDEAMGIDGYVSTPGGRLWYIDSSDMIISQICGYGCLPKDSRFIKGSDGKIAQSYTFEQLVKALGG